MVKVIDRFSSNYVQTFLYAIAWLAKRAHWYFTTFLGSEGVGYRILVFGAPRSTFENISQIYNVVAKDSTEEITEYTCYFLAHLVVLYAFVLVKLIQYVAL